MFAEYVEWQFILAPRFLLTLIWNLQWALQQFFSVPTMLRTLFAHWHRDVVPYRAGTISGLLLAFAWNQISRAIGFIIRSIMLLMWLTSAVVLLAAGAGVLLALVSWPFLIVIGFLWACFPLFGV